MIDAIIFDFDGLILDTETAEYDAWQEFFTEHGVELALDVWSMCIGQRSGVFNPIGHLESLLGRAVHGDSLRARHRERFHALVFAESVRPGIMDYLDHADCDGIKLAVASSATRDWVEGHLERLGIAHRFSCIHTVEDVVHAKPHPDLFELALRTLDVQPDRAIVLEDSPNGVLAANRAGIFSVAVPNRVTASLEWQHANLVLDSLASCSLRELLERVRAARAAV
ncbi:MAG: HAD-IA family hydrolase [Candidatus Hydrogenedentes bacterium]|nr:HAD-IA family hydrolase [Candidatus Hydrogenedentota bacterium]